MKILVLNCGSSSVKFQFFNMTDESTLLGGLVEKIGEPNSQLSWEKNGARETKSISARDHTEALEHIRELFADIAVPDAVGHRVVFGGELSSGPVLVTDVVEALIDSYSEMAPLHNPPNLAGIRAAKKFFPGAPHVSVFDTAFHQTMPARAYLYAIPYEYYEVHRIRRYGFHGISHRYVAERAAAMLGIHNDAFTGITAHLGNGCSLTAVQSGKSVDTTMGMTPLEGVMMGTRCGDIDPAIVFHLMSHFNLSPEAVQNILQKDSGLKGLSGLSNDLRDVEAAAATGHERSRLAIEVYAYRVRKYIGAYLAVLDAPRAITFAGGVGQHSAEMRERILNGLDHFGLHFDAEKNAAADLSEAEITRPGSPLKILVIPTNEELMIARDTRRLVGK